MAFSSRTLSHPEKNYAVTELETLAVVWAIKHYRVYVYGHDVQVVTDHSAVKALLATPSVTGKHACWWLQVFGSGVRKLDIVYHPRREHERADALSRNPVSTMSPGPCSLDTQVAAVGSQDTNVTKPLNAPPGGESSSDFHSSTTTGLSCRITTVESWPDIFQDLIVHLTQSVMVVTKYVQGRSRV